MSGAIEVNCDGLIGPTHNYAGLAFGNVASQKNGLTVSNPREAALQGLAKMKFLADLGLKQIVLPPQPRPDLQILRRLGFGGKDSEIVARAYKESPRLLAACYSASSMWVANAATVSPSADSADNRVHFTPANLISNLHRAIETKYTAGILKQIFADERHFSHHPPLPAADALADEGAANHTRLCAEFDQRGLEIFVHGREGSIGGEAGPAKYPARQTRQASAAIARLHQLQPDSTLFLRQHPAAIDGGAFHNDVVAVGNRNVFLCHAEAYADENAADLIRNSFAACCGGPFYFIEAQPEQVSLSDAVHTYLFNSQLVSLREGSMALIAPEECREHAGVQRFIAEILASDNPISAVHYVDLRQSMCNGGGPACLRLRVVLTAEELANVHAGALLTPALYESLAGSIRRRYRDRLAPEDLADPSLITESRDALDELMNILSLDLGDSRN